MLVYMSLEKQYTKTCLAFLKLPILAEEFTKNWKKIITSYVKFQWGILNHSLVKQQKVYFSVPICTYVELATKELCIIIPYKSGPPCPNILYKTIFSGAMTCFP